MFGACLSIAFSVIAAAEPLNLCAQHYAQDFKLPLGQLNTAAVPIEARPDKAEPVHGVFGACVLRATKYSKEPPIGFARSDYSRRQAFNADSTKFLVYANNGYWHLYDARTQKHLKRLSGPTGDAEPQWHPNNPDSLYFVPNNGGLEIRELNVVTNRSARVARFHKRLPWRKAVRVWTRSEGSPSADGRYWALMAETQDFYSLGMIVYDMVDDKIISSYDFEENDVGRPDHVSMSPSGDFVVASWPERYPGTVAFSRDFSRQQQLIEATSHSDIALLPNGNDAYVTLDYRSARGDVLMVELQTGERTVLFPTYVGHKVATAIHFSGKAYNKPGWVLVSTYAQQGSSHWFHEKLFAMELKEKPTILNIAHHNSVFNGYWTEPHATVNKDFTRILFNSNWGDGSSELDIDAYLVELPAHAIP